MSDHLVRLLAALGGSIVVSVALIWLIELVFPTPRASPRTRRPRKGRQDLDPWRDDLSVIDHPEAFDYRVFTTEFDEEVDAADLVEEPERAERRSEFERLLAERGPARETIERVLSAVKTESKPSADVTLLIDCSGSLRGRPATEVALAAALVGEALEAGGAAVEILGFTTVRWKGGRARETWIAQGRPNDPGRLNDLLHVIFKPYDQSAPAAALGLAALISPGGEKPLTTQDIDKQVLKENIDGEALVWAYRRLLTRRVLLVISDGAPVDDSTLLENTDTYLLRHLRHVIRDIEARGGVELVALGVGHEVGQCYRRSALATDLDVLAERAAGLIGSLFGPGRDISQ